MPLPLLIRKDKLPEFKVSQDDAHLVAVSHSRCHLVEEPGSRLLVQLLATFHKHVHVTIVLLQEDISLPIPQDDIFDVRDVPVCWENTVSPDLLLVVDHVKHLWNK